MLVTHATMLFTRKTQSYESLVTGNWSVQSNNLRLLSSISFGLSKSFFQVASTNSNG